MAPPQGFPAESFPLFWLWHRDQWVLGRRDSNGSTFTVFYSDCDDQGLANVVRGPQAGVIEPPPIDKPSWPPQIPTLAQGWIWDAERGEYVKTAGHHAGGNRWGSFIARLSKVVPQCGLSTYQDGDDILVSHADSPNLARFSDPRSAHTWFDGFTALLRIRQRETESPKAHAGGKE